MSASLNLMRDIFRKLSQPPTNPKSEFGKLVKYVDDNPMVKAAIRNNLTSDEEVLNMIRYAGPSLDENGTPRSANDPVVVKDFEAYKKFKTMAQDYLDNQEKKKLSRKINYQEFKKKVWNNWNKVTKWETSLSNKMLNTIKKIIPTEIDDAILKLGNKANDLTDAAVDKVTEYVNKRINKKINELKAKENEIGGKQNKTMKENKNNSNKKRNHSTWYTRFRAKEVSTVPNYDNAIDEWITLEDGSTTKRYLRPLVVRFPVSLVMPNSTKLTQRLFDSINANQTSLMNARGVTNVVYDIKDVTNYIENTNFVLALIAKAQRTIKSYNNFNIDNSLEPRVLIYSSNPAYYTYQRIETEKKSLVSLKEDLRLLIESFKTNVAGSIPLYEKTMFLLSNYFKDNKSSKNVVYSFDLDDNDSTGVFTYTYRTGTSTIATETVTLTDVASIINTAEAMIQRCFVLDKYAKQIKSDIQFLFGLTKAQHFSYELSKVQDSINKPVDVIGDDYNILHQIQNMSIMKRPSHSSVFSGNHVGYNVYSNDVSSDEILLHESPFNGISGTPSVTFDPNTDKITSEKILNSDETYSATRFMDYFNTNDLTISSVVKESSNHTGIISQVVNISNSSYAYNTFVLVHSVQVITYNVTFTGTGYEFDRTIIILPGNIGPVRMRGVQCSQISENEYVVNRAMAWWSYCDWMPRMFIGFYVAADIDTDAETVVLSTHGNTYQQAFDYNLIGVIPLTNMKYIHATAAISQLIWSDNGNTMINPNIKAANNANNKGRSNNNK